MAVYILFHNEHQIQDCIRLSQKMGFKKFEFVKNARYYDKAYHYKSGETLDLRPWSQDKKFNRKHKIKNFVETKNCMHLSIPSIFLSSSGIVSPCCYMREQTINKISINEEFNSGLFRTVCKELWMNKVISINLFAFPVATWKLFSKMSQV